MATRSRTLLFVQCRHSYPRARRRQAAESAVLSEKAAAFGSAAHSYQPVRTETISAVALPPVWVDAVEDFEPLLARIQQLLTQLETLHRRNLLPGFDDRDSEFAAIERATQEIAELFRAAQRRLAEFERAAVAPDGPSQARKLHSNVAAALTTRVSGLSTTFRKAQSNFLARLRSRASSSSKDIRNPPGLEQNEARFQSQGLLMADSLDDPEMGGSPSGGFAPLVFTGQQTALVDRNRSVIDQRDREINDIARTITDVSELFKDLRTLVIDQGSLLDRIDYNMELAATNVADAKEELGTADKTQAATRKKKIILLLVLVVVALILGVIIKSRSKNTIQT